MLSVLEHPRFCGLGQFSLYILSLRQDQHRFGAARARRIAEKLRQGGEGAGRHHIGDGQLRRLDALVANGHVVEAHGFGGGGEESRFLAGRFDHGDGDAAVGEGGREYEPREPSAGTEIDKGSRIIGDQREQLSAVREMPRPAFGQGRARHEIVDRRPFHQHAVIFSEAVAHGFGQAEMGGEGGRTVDFVQRHVAHEAARPARRTWPATRARAAGVTPSRRPA